jgi:hypothetical protein
VKPIESKFHSYVGRNDDKLVTGEEYVIEILGWVFYTKIPAKAIFSVKHCYWLIRQNYCILVKYESNLMELSPLHLHDNYGYITFNETNCNL